jgi:hypothetical protein|tara:strand:- start:36 stop:293 length:258 start_codon:yes stop_codon:yes gene_type:complete
VRYVDVNNTVIDRAVNARTVPIAVANSVRPKQNLNKYSHNNVGGLTMKNIIDKVKKNKKAMIGVAVIIVIFAWMLIANEPAPTVE